MIPFVSTITLEAPAKINLTLHVLGLRPDGYHEIDSLMAPLDLADTVRVETRGSGEVAIRVTCPGHPDLDGPANLAHRAAEAYLRARGATASVDIRIGKRIPVQAGLGGGSSDAAAVLLGLARLDDAPLPDTGLAALAAQLGADVPFFLAGGPCRATGIGERLEPVRDLPDFWTVLACAPFGLSAREVYQRLTSPLTSTGSDDKHASPVSVADFEALTTILHNDLQPVGERLRPVIATVGEQLSRAGAGAVLMTGSGPTVFGLFRSRDHAVGALERLDRELDWVYLAARGMTSGTRATA
jgi:4-diphosphocytidyl-2-C-methyl-D-erythritol kinase